MQLVSKNDITVVFIHTLCKFTNKFEYMLDSLKKLDSIWSVAFF